MDTERNLQEALAQLNTAKANYAAARSALIRAERIYYEASRLWRDGIFHDAESRN